MQGSRKRENVSNIKSIWFYRELKKMKKGLKPTNRQKIAIKAVGLNWEHWLVYKNVDGYLHLLHRETNTTRMIPSK